MEFRISDRLAYVASLVRKGNIVADIGTDHGYLPIYLIKQNITQHVIGMDLRKGPLQKATDNIRGFHVQNEVTLRLSDGLEQLAPQEADTVTICGMGGKLIQSILLRGRDKLTAQTQLLLSPQSELEEFRRFLQEYGIEIRHEHMLSEDGQFYVIMECYWTGIAGKDTDNIVSAQNLENTHMAEACDNNVKNITNDSHKVQCTDNDDISEETFFKYGEYLLVHKNECLRDYLLHEKKVNESVTKTVQALQLNEGIARRLAQLEQEHKCIVYALSFYE